MSDASDAQDAAMLLFLFQSLRLSLKASAPSFFRAVSKAVTSPCQTRGGTSGALGIAVCTHLPTEAEHAAALVIACKVCTSLAEFQHGLGWRSTTLEDGTLAESCHVSEPATTSSNRSQNLHRPPAASTAARSVFWRSLA